MIKLATYLCGYQLVPAHGGQRPAAGTLGLGETLEYSGEMTMKICILTKCNVSSLSMP